MSVKRQATTELNHENWDQDDASEPEEMGAFKAASQDVLEKRVIKVAKRRCPTTGDTQKKSVFSGFGGFNKAQPPSFDFLANVIKTSKNANGSPTKTDAAVSSSLFTSKPVSNTTPVGGLFGIPASSSSTKSPFGTPTTQTSSLFGGSSANNSNTPSSVFTASKADSTVGDSPFKIQTVSSSGDTNNVGFTKTTNANSNASTSQVSSTIFGVPSTSANKSLFGIATTSASPFKIQSVSSTTTAQAGVGVTSKPASNADDLKETEDVKNEKRMKYYTKLKGLNEAVSAWIKKHVEQTPLCILSPIFKDYERYLKEIQDEYETPDQEQSKTDNNENRTLETNISAENTPSKTSETTLFKSDSSNNKAPVFGTQNNTSTGPKSSPFSFGINTSIPASNTTNNTSAGFSFGITSDPGAATNTTTASFSFGTNTSSSNTNGTASFSFGTGKPFSFNSNIQAKPESATTNENEEDDQPPKVDFTPIVEENSVYDKRCKIFVKKDGNFADKGVGTLYIKKIEDSGKHQLLVRANTNLGNILVNLILASAIPTQRMGKNNVMMVCIPTPDSKPPPTPILIRVKTSEEADELLETLNKYKA